ncbi:MAG TPA: type II toxin-antitoxin system VapC family toxin [Blastocatellia bacterium]|nr:type II toxin-antitoxin system VapC family toxin [Blastocatellia bacterium]
MIIVDANLMVALVSGDARGNQVLQQFIYWLNQDISLNAPVLAKYEIANALTRLIVAGKFSMDDVPQAWSDLTILPITYYEMINAQRVIEISLALKRQSAYDAAYLELSERLGAQLWTLDGPLYRNALSVGFSVRLIQ